MNAIDCVMIRNADPAGHRALGQQEAPEAINAALQRFIDGL
ncbi:hypothetical protein [Bradyrhizobium lablabi]|nr:hypothetical protein [Bradyrhizobium lablabi]